MRKSKILNLINIFLIFLSSKNIILYEVVNRH
ncbi:Uncharacterized protein GY17_00003984 [Cryptosporidium hominis]|uniref:Uncharacterized protein n=1 Tax=Cryptosporidium hominis TaxID=237895 RepID=A0ABX5B7I2_CRYHO|nr:Uncharacterized protein GY17_00003984 [Cryptosporidium hominis]|eukprot:PPS91939.1 Uncharacterized protein GY17_00003984 [Cryptosporidium hominis]